MGQSVSLCSFASKRKDRFVVECSFCAEPVTTKLTTNADAWKLIGRCRCQWIERRELTREQTMEAFGLPGPLVIGFAEQASRTSSA